MQKNGVKLVYCKLFEFVEMGTAGKPHVYVARIYLQSEHPVLGLRTEEKLTQTSQVLNIDFQDQCFETRNTVYRWGRM